MKNSHGLRIAIVGSPRSGNTWLHCLLSAIYQVTVRAVHRPSDLSWSNLPEGCIVQLHWHPTVEFQALLREHGFQIVVLARHPFDVLISILHFANHESEIGQWLDGELGGERSLINATPISPRFMAYAESSRAAVLVGLSQEWSEVGEIVVVRYEDLVANPQSELQRLGESLGAPVAPERIAESITEYTFAALQKTNKNHHFWKGKPGLWKSFLPLVQAQRIYEVHRTTFEAFGYSCDADDQLQLEQAVDNWNEHQVKATVPQGFNSIAERLFDRITDLESQLRLAERELTVFRNAAKTAALLVDSPVERSSLPLEQGESRSIPGQFHLPPGQFFSQVGKGVKHGILIPSGVTESYVVFGPYLKLPVGRYRANFRFVEDLLPSDRLRLDVIYSPSGDILAERHCSAGPLATLEFVHRNPDALLEYRIFAEGEGATHPSLFTGVELERTLETCDV